MVCQPALDQRHPGYRHVYGGVVQLHRCKQGLFNYAYSASPAMAANMDNISAKYPATFTDADGAVFALYYLHPRP